MNDKLALELSGRSRANLTTLSFILIVFVALLVEDLMNPRAVTILTFGTGCLLLGQLCRVALLKVKLSNDEIQFRTVWGRTGEARANYALISLDRAVGAVLIGEDSKGRSFRIRLFNSDGDLVEFASKLRGSRA